MDGGGGGKREKSDGIEYVVGKSECVAREELAVSVLAVSVEYLYPSVTQLRFSHIQNHVGALYLAAAGNFL